VASSNQQEQTFQNYIRLLNVSSIEEARNVSTAKLQLANAITVGLANYGGFTYGPVVDGDFTPALPGQLLARGKFDKNVKVMVGHNANEVSETTALCIKMKSNTPVGSFVHSAIRQQRHRHPETDRSHHSIDPCLPRSPRLPYHHFVPSGLRWQPSSRLH